jgi:single-stranded DNA-binding protein
MKFNQCTFIGNTGSAPKLFTTGSSKAFAKLRLAIHSYAKEEAQEPMWFTVLVWREDLAKTPAEILK